MTLLFRHAVRILKSEDRTDSKRANVVEVSLPSVR